MSEELKPCPFCGKLRPDHWTETNRIVLCPHCETAALRRMWNRRPIEDALLQRIAELEYILSQFSGWWSGDCPEPCPYREKRIQDELEYGGCKTREEAEMEVSADYMDTCGEQPGECWIEHYRNEFREKKPGAGASHGGC